MSIVIKDIELREIYKRGRICARNTNIKLPQHYIGSLTQAHHPYYVIEYYDPFGERKLTVHFNYDTIECNTGCNSIW
jgi:hypothetical protein